MEQLEKLQHKYGKKLRELILQPAFFIENFIIDFKLTDYQKEWLDLCRANSRLSLQAFRSSGKTEILLVDDTIHWAFTHPGSQQLMISNTLPQATELLRRIKDRIIDSDLLRTSIDSNYWTKTDITLKNKARILCKPYNENVRMLHVDRVKCFLGNTKVDCLQDSKEIKDINVGDLVRTHNGELQEVIRVYKNFEKCYAYYVKSGFNEFKVTKGHKLLVLRNNSFDWIEVNKLLSSDRLLYPNRMKSQINDDLAYLYGWYIAEGDSFSGKGIRFTLGNKEVVHANRIAKIIKEQLNLNVKIKSYNSWSITIYACSKEISKQFVSMFGNNAHNKNFPLIKFSGLMDSKTKSMFLLGFLRGDGHFMRTRGYICHTVSDKLRDNLVKLLKSMSMSISFKKKRNPSSKLVKSDGFINEILIHKSSTNKLLSLCGSIRNGDYLSFKLKRVKRVEIFTRDKGRGAYVYNLEVQNDNSYIANGVIAHNCDEMGEYRDHDVLKSAVFPTLTAKHGDFCGVGTPKSEVDILHYLKKDSTFKSLTYPAWTKEVNLFNQRYPDYEVKKKDGLYVIWDTINKKAIGSYTSMEWSREFMCKCLSAGDRIYPYTLIEQSFDYNRKLSKIKKPGATYWIGLDFALSTSKNADRSAFFVIERFKEKDTLMWIEHYHGLSYMAQKKRIQELHDFFAPSKMVCDQGTFGESFFQEMRSIGIPMEGFKFTNQSKQDLIQEMRARFESNFNRYDEDNMEIKPEEDKQLFICKDRTDHNTHILTDKLVKEMLAFSIQYDTQTGTAKFKGIGAHDDMVMGLGMALWASRVKGSRCFHVSRGKSSKRRLFRIA